MNKKKGRSINLFLKMFRVSQIIKTFDHIAIFAVIIQNQIFNSKVFLDRCLPLHFYLRILAFVCLVLKYS